MYLTGKPLPLRAGSLSPAARDGSAAGESRGEGCSGALCFCSLCLVAAAPAGEPACRLAPDGDTHPGPGRQAALAAHPAGVGQRRDPGKDGMPKTHAMAARNSPSFTQLIWAPACTTPLPVSAPSDTCPCLRLPAAPLGQGRGTRAAETGALVTHSLCRTMSQCFALPTQHPPAQSQPVHICCLTTHHPGVPSS